MSTFSVAWDYRCPFARNAHEHLIAGLRAGAQWDVTFAPFSLGQVHVADGEPDVWDDDTKTSGLIAMEAGIVVRDTYPDRFLDVHQAFFDARHDEGRDIREPEVVRGVLSEHGVDADAVWAQIEEGGPREVFRKEHQTIVQEHKVWGVPTFMAGDASVFVRLMTRPQGDAELAVKTIDRVIDLVTGFPELNEFKHTSISR
ncbi:MAG: FIG00659836: hypothetical protein [uncultured Acidimicrobiales bacterium]|uniref:DSBA-like thioredoxin domain-containing protein n=1 Tax=uncultured Acidimicrobiales bacterium TaxID=310071 RepID=A0A6J4HMA2_9ACTN|nr:MAG: FIG00659836: hypothetical protein [uncultured Acidimicrobiales bacterium]